MLGLGLGEIALVAVVLLLVVGPEQLPPMMRWLGRTYGQLRRASDELRRAFVLEADRMDAEERRRELEKRRAEAAAAREQALERGAQAQPRRLPTGQDQAAEPAASQAPIGPQEEGPSEEGP